MLENKHIGMAVKHIRKMNRFTQKELAEASKLSESYLSTLETGKRGLTIDTLNTLAVNLNTKPHIIMYLAEYYSNNNLKTKTHINLEKIL